MRVYSLLIAVWLLLLTGPRAAATNEKDSPKSQAPADALIALPLNFQRYTGDLDEMAKRHTIRAIVLLDPIGFFYVNGAPQGAMYEALMAFGRFVNEELKTGRNPIQITFLPLRPDQAELALEAGLGDVIAHQLIVTPERERRVSFTAPIRQDVTEIIVTGAKDSGAMTLSDLSGREIYANPLSVFHENLRKANESLVKAGKKPMVLKDADANLSEHDLLQMVHAGAIPMTVATKMRAEFWAKVLGGIRPHPELAIASGGQVAWAVRKDSPRLKQLLDRFVPSHAVGTSFGNTLLRRYLKDTRWVKNATSPQEMAKFHALVDIFRKYGSEYDFDYLMLAAEGYQESRLNQSERSQGGAVGIMQVIPKYAGAPPISVRNVYEAEGNIHAGAKMLRTMANQYFNQPGLDPMNRSLMLFASYNAGPNRIAELRRKAKERGLDPNVWFGNVELMAAMDIGQEVVLYVGNVYKYYVAYKLTQEQSQLR